MECWKSANKKNIELLKQHFKKEDDNSHERAVFVGAGASVFLEIKSWKQLLADMNNFFESGINVEESIANIGYPETASLIYDNNKKGDDTSKTYKHFMGDQFNPTRGHHYSLHIKIWTVFDLILTTNFDGTFESAHSDLNDYLFSLGHSRKRYKKQILPDFDFTKIMSDPTLIYLHGHKECERYIFRKEEYDLNYGNPSRMPRSDLEIFLEEVFHNIAILFIGFSFNDPYFIEFFKRTIKDFEIRKNQFERVYEQEYTKKLPVCMAILHKQSVQNYMLRSKIEELFNGDESWYNLFEDHTRNELFFKPDALRILEDITINRELKNEIVYYYNKIKENNRRMDDLNQLNMEIIVVDDHNCTEEILNLLKKEESGIADEGDAKYAVL